MSMFLNLLAEYQRAERREKKKCTPSLGSHEAAQAAEHDLELELELELELRTSGREFDGPCLRVGKL